MLGKLTLSVFGLIGLVHTLTLLVRELETFKYVLMGLMK